MQSKRPRLSFAKIDFEDIFGRRLAIWAGGIALAISGVLAVRYSIESGLMTPVVRVAFAFLGGATLLAAAEIAHRNQARIADARVPQTLAGAGLATLYAAFYLAGTQYGLIGQTFAFLGLAAITGAAIALSYRFGVPSAILGLVGGFAAPVLVGGDEANIPLLALYLGLVTGGLCLTGRTQKRAWMGVAALVGGLGWGAVLLLGDGFSTLDVLVLGAYFIALSSVLPRLIEHDRLARPLRAIAAGIASLQLAVLVAQAGYTPLAWALYLLMGATLAWFAWRRDDIRMALPVAASIGLFLLMLWPNPVPVRFALVAAGMVAIFTGVPLALMAKERDGLAEQAMTVSVPPVLAVLAYAAFGDLWLDRVEWLLAVATLSLCGPPILGAWLVARREGGERLFAALIGVAGALVFAAGLMVTPGWFAPVNAALVIGLWLASRRDDTPMVVLLWTGAGVALVSLIVTPNFFDEAQRLVTGNDGVPLAKSLLRWAAAGVPLLVLCFREGAVRRRQSAEAAAALLAYGLAAQLLPTDALAWASGLAAIALFQLRRERVGAIAAWTAIALAWAAAPLALWLGAAFEALVGNPILLFELPSPVEATLHLLPAVATLAFVSFERFGQGWRSHASHWLALPLGLVVLHIFYRQIFAIDTMTQFIDRGMAERTVWQALLLGAASIVARGSGRFAANPHAAAALACASLAHFAVYSLWWHNPMTAAQAVGSTPVANLFFAAFSIALAASLLLRDCLSERLRPLCDGLVMLLATLGALALLRQAFGGSTPHDVPLGQTEDLLRSLIGIVMALAFLWIGSRLGQRSWRVGSLVVMLIALIKVFAFDAAGLSGLLRIASFAALGASLIGLGWFYTRQLKAAAPD
ncbi:DUF2339 domain-containing protein [Qipengyuania sp. CAU 1752]